MKRLVVLSFFLCLQVFGIDLITINIVTTNNPIGNTNKITVNTSTRTVTNNAASSLSTLIQETNSVTRFATNLANHFVVSRPNSVQTISVSSNRVLLLGTLGASMSASIAGNWGYIYYTTNSLGSAINVRMPIEVEAPTNRTNIASMLVDSFKYSTNLFATNGPASGNYLSKGASPAQTVMGQVVFQTGVGGTNLGLTNGYIINANVTGGVYSANIGNVTNGNFWSPKLSSPTLTNGVNRGNAFSSRGSGSSSEQFGASAQATNTADLAVGNLALAQGGLSIAIGFGATTATNAVEGIAIGTTATSAGLFGTAIGAGATATGSNSIALGPFASTPYDNSVAIGRNAASTAAGNLALGDNVSLVTIPGILQAATITNATLTGTNILNGTIGMPNFSISTVAAGHNVIDIGTNSWIRVTGTPGGAWTLAGIKGALHEGRQVWISLETSYDVTIWNEDGINPVANSRLRLNYSSPTTNAQTTGDAVVKFIYDNAHQRWLLESISDLQTAIATNAQPASAALTNLAMLGPPGIVVETSTNNFVTRSILSGSSLITVSGGSMVAGNATIGFLAPGIANEIPFNDGFGSLTVDPNLKFDPALPQLQVTGDAVFNGSVLAQAFVVTTSSQIAASSGTSLSISGQENVGGITVTQNINMLSIPISGSVIDWNYPRQHGTLGVSSNFTFANVTAGNEVRVVLLQNSVGGYQPTLPPTVVFVNATNQSGTLGIDTNANMQTSLYLYIANGKTNCSMSPPDSHILNQLASLNYSTNGLTYMISNGAPVLVPYGVTAGGATGTNFNALYVTNDISLSRLYVRSNINLPSTAISGTIIDWNQARQEGTLGVNTNFTFVNVAAGNEIRVVLKQNSTGGYQVTLPATVVFFNATNQSGTLGINTNANAQTALTFFIANGVTNCAITPCDDPHMNQLAGFDFTQTGTIAMVTNGGFQQVNIPVDDPSDNTIIKLRDEFIGGSIFDSSRAILGELGWEAVSTGTIVPTNLFILNGGHPGILALPTTTNQFGYSVLSMGDLVATLNGRLSLPLGLMTNWESTFDWRVDSTNFIKAFVGFTATAASPNTRPAHGLYIQYDTANADSNWCYTAAQAATFTSKGSGIQSTNWMHLRMFCNVSNNIVFQANYGAFYTNTVNNPTNFLTPYFAIANTAIGGPNNTNEWLYADRWSFKAVVPQR